jgi:Protein of unknown function (DUF551)
MEWIKCSERLPDIIDDYLILTRSQQMYVGRWIPDKKKKFRCWSIQCDCMNAEGSGDEDYNVTHWADLPKPPKE